MAALPSTSVGTEKKPIALPVERHRYAAGQKVEPVGAKVGHQGRPGRLDEHRIGAERMGEPRRQVDVEAREGASRGILDAEGLVIAGQTDAEPVRGEDAVEERPRQRRRHRRRPPHRRREGPKPP